MSAVFSYVDPNKVGKTKNKRTHEQEGSSVHVESGRTLFGDRVDVVSTKSKRIKNRSKVSNGKQSREVVDSFTFTPPPVTGDAPPAYQDDVGDRPPPFSPEFTEQAPTTPAAPSIEPEFVKPSNQRNSQYIHKSNASSTTSKSSFPLVVGGVCFLVVLACWMMSSSTCIAEARNPYWKRWVNLEDHVLARRSAFSLPVGAVVISSETRISHYDQIADGERTTCSIVRKLISTEEVYVRTDRFCDNQGHCTEEDVFEEVEEYGDVEECATEVVYREEPVYGVYYTYDVWEWQQRAPVVRDGHGMDVEWPNVFINEQVREVKRGEEYTVDLMDTSSSRTWKHSIQGGVDAYRRFVPGSRWKVSYSTFGITEVHST